MYVFEPVMGTATPFYSITKGEVHASGRDPIPPGISIEINGDIKQDKYETADYIVCPYPVVSDTIGNALAALSLPGLQVHPITVTCKKDTYEGYHLLHLTNRIDVLDEEASDIIRTETGRIAGFNRVAFDQKKWDDTDEQQRHLFMIQRKRIVFCDELVAGLIKSHKPSGLALVPLAEWNSGLELWPGDEEKYR